jgi:hypothetical protein
MTNLPSRISPNSGNEVAIQDAARRLAPIIRTAAYIAASPEFDGRWCESITVPRVFFDSEIPKTNNVCIRPARSQKTGELVRVNWDLFGVSACLIEFSNLLRLELEPFIIGCGYIVTDDLPEGGIVVLRDYGKHFEIGHDLAPDLVGTDQDSDGGEGRHCPSPPDSSASVR